MQYQRPSGNFGYAQAPQGQFAMAPQVQGQFTMAPQGQFTMAPQVAAARPAVNYVQQQQPMAYAAAPAPAVNYVQMQQPGAAYAGAREPLSANAMAKLKEFAVGRHWGPRSTEFEPVFAEAGSGAAALNYQQLQKFYTDSGTKFFGESLVHLLTPDIFERFDFNGDGKLDFYQAKRSLKCILYEVYHTSGGETQKPIEFQTPSQKGYTIIKELARGGQGAAILASSDKYGQVVLKTYEKSNPNAGTIDEHIAEMEVLRELQQESYVMHAWDIFQDDKCVYCVNELMAGGDLEALREKAAAARIPLTEDYFRNIFKQTLLGLHHIHEHGLMHCDLKEPNIMMKTTDLANPEVAIIDFGLAHVCAGPGEAGGTPGYIPPETNSRHIWYPKGDIFSLGVAFFGLLADRTPSEKLGTFGVFQEGCRTIEDVVLFTATRQLPLHLISGSYPGVMSWLPKMCSKEKHPRPRALQLLESPFFGGETEISFEGRADSVQQPVQIRSPIQQSPQMLGQSPQLLGQPRAAKIVSVGNPYSAGVGNAYSAGAVQAPYQPQQMQMQVQGFTAGGAYAPRVQMMSPAVRR